MYSKTVWTTGDLVTAALMNNLETQYDGVMAEATSAATANKLVLRDASGRAKVAAPSAVDDIARLDSITAAQAGAVAKAGDTMTGALIAPGIQVQQAGNASIEIGRIDGVASTPFIDFHSGAVAVDYDARIIASGGTGVNVGGTLNIMATALQHNSSQIWHAGNDGPGSTLDADTVDTFHFRETSGVLEYYSGGTWKPVAFIANTPATADYYNSATVSGTWYTVLNITDNGVLYRAIVYSSVATSVVLEIRITVDGVAYTVDATVNTPARAYALGGSSIPVEMEIKFDSSLLIEIRHTYGSDTNLWASVDYGLI